MSVTSLKLTTILIHDENSNQWTLVLDTENQRLILENSNDTLVFPLEQHFINVISRLIAQPTERLLLAQAVAKVRQAIVGPSKTLNVPIYSKEINRV
jgi:hypothetical protein